MSLKKLIAYYFQEIAVNSNPYWLLVVFLGNDTFIRLALFSERIDDGHFFAKDVIACVLFRNLMIQLAWQDVSLRRAISELVIVFFMCD